MRPFFTITILYFVLCNSVNLFAQPAKIIVEDPGAATPWNHLNVNNDENQFQFAIVTDRTGGHRPGIFMDGINKLNLLQPEFVMSVGDLIEGYTEDRAEINRQWDEFDGFIEKLEVPFFYTVGNHDYTNPVMAEIWKERLGPTYYHFTYKDVLFVCLNSEEDRANEGGVFTKILDDQFEYVKKVLAENTDVKWTLVFMHKPMWVYDNTGRWEEIDAILGDRPHTVFAGHQHHYVKYERNNGKYFMLATTGGGSGLRGPSLGEFDHVVWATMTEDGPVLANLMLDGIWSEDVVTEKQWELVSKVRRESPMRVSPMLVEKELFSSAETELRITNDSDVPLKVKLGFENYLELRPGYAHLEKEIAPNSVEKVMLPIAVVEETAVDEIEPMVIKSTFTYTGENIPAVEFTNRIGVKPVQPKPVAKASEPIAVDGELSEWENLTYEIGEENIEANPFSHSGKEDAQVSFDARYDDQFFYLALKVEDDEVLSDADRSYWEQDAIMIQIHAGPLAQSASATSMWSGIGILQNPSDSEGMERVYRADRLPEGVKTVCKVVDGGFVAETAIPTALMDSLQGKNWEYVRLNVGVMDYDQAYSHRSQILWQPSWESEATYVGSGMFQKEGMKAENDTGRK